MEKDGLHKEMYRPLGNLIAAYQYDPGTIKVPIVYNPNDIEVPFMYDARQGNITLDNVWSGSDNGIVVKLPGREVDIGNDWTSVKINPNIDLTVPVVGRTGKGGGDGGGVGLCGSDPCKEALDDCVWSMTDWYDGCGMSCNSIGNPWLSGLCSAGCTAAWLYLMGLCRLAYNDCVKKRNQNN
jgi:hypothetical protein